MLKKKNKFEDVKATLDTGLHSGNVLIIPKKRGELFRRLKTSEIVTILQLFLNEIGKNDAESICNLMEGTHDSNVSAHQYQDDDDECDEYVPSCDVSSSFLLLDIRGDAEFAKYHIKSAKHYDTSLLRRDKLGHDIYAFKNKQNKIIIVCCDDESAGVHFCNQLCQKYIDNIFLLSTSVNRFCQRYSDLCVGEQKPKNLQDSKPKIRIRFADWNSGSQQKYKKKRSSSSAVSMKSLSTSMSFVSTATTARTWKP